MANAKRDKPEAQAKDPSSPSLALQACLLPALVTGWLLWACHFPLAWGWLAWGALVFFLAALQWMRHADWRMYFTWPLLAVYCSLFYLLNLFLLRLLDRRTRLPLVLTVPVVWTAVELFRAWFLGGFSWYFLAHTQHDLLPIIQVADVTGIWGVTFLVAAVNAVLFEWLSRVENVRRLLGLPAERMPSVRSLTLQTSCVAVLLAGVLSYGFWQLGRGGFECGPRVALIQGNIPQSIRNDSSGPDGEAKESSSRAMMRHYDLISTIAGFQQPRPDLIIWPETCYPDEWTALGDGVRPEDVPSDVLRWMAEERALARDAVQRWRTNILLGVNFRLRAADGHSYRRNSALLILRQEVPLGPAFLAAKCAADAAVITPPLGGLAEIITAAHTSGLHVLVQGPTAGRYDKMHLVPFGEYVPWRNVLPFMNWFAPYDFEYSVQPGDRQTRFPFGRYTFGSVICYEDTDPFLARYLVLPEKDAPPVDFVTNTSNDGWFRGSSEHEEHLAVARFRAVECRRPLVRAVNMGISAVIDSNGAVVPPETREMHEVQGRWAEVLRSVPIWEAKFRPRSEASLPPSRWAEFKATPGVLLADLPLDHRPSLYAAWGDWLPLACWGVLGLGVAWGVLRPRRLEAAP